MQRAQSTVLKFIIVLAVALIAVAVPSHSACAFVQDAETIDTGDNGPAANGSVTIVDESTDSVSESTSDNETVIEPVEQNNETEAKAELPENERKLLGFDSGLFQIKPSAKEAVEEADESFFAGWLPDGFGEIGRTVGGLAIVIGILLFIFSIMKKMGGPLSTGKRPSGVLEILARYPVARGQRMLLLKVDRRILLVHQCGNAMSTLSEFTNREEVASLLAKIEAGSRSKSGRSFRKVLSGAESGYEGTTDKSSMVETIDLTKTQVGGLGRSLGRRPARA